ncbi:hypothetical protein P43SY_002928 [Pythium insidiosum]|uniref:Uncharacterized protein n=1 Tax=Pythium insidiosum TaxID=114742 RepID=A0AAD5Q2Y7_PYTIN|nr:hypothetical protein P43SY_002928 [Pythium insidiosum]
MARHATAEQIARWRFLSRWFRVLRKDLGFIESDEWESQSLHSSLETLCVYVPYPIEHTPEYAQRLRRLREAMELVGLALQLDCAAWYHLTDANNASLATFDPDDYSVEDLTPRFAIKAYNKWNFGGDSVDSISKVNQLLLGIDSDEFSDEYRICRDAVLAMDERGVLTHFQVPVALVFQPIAWIDPQAYMSLARGLTTELYWKSRQGNCAGGATHSNWYPFALVEMGLYASEVTVSGELVDTLDLALELGLAVPEISFEPLVYCDSALAMLCTKATASRAATHCRSHVGSLAITRTDLTSFRLCCQCLMTSQSVRRVKWISSLEDEDHGLEKWRELGRAFFSRKSTCAVRELHIDEATLMVADIDALRQGIQGDTIQQRETDRVSRHGPVERFVRFDLATSVQEPCVHGPTQTLDSIGYEQDEWAKVLVDDSGTEWMHVELPRYGARWVECRGVIDVKTVTTADVEQNVRRRNHAAPRITSLKISIDHCEIRAMPSLVSLIGSSLTALHIVMKDSRVIQQHDVHTILEACPLLEFLYLRRATLKSMELFVDAYESQRCRLSTLSLWNVDVSNGSLRTFAKCLSDSSHIMTQTLREFRYIWDDIGCPGDVDHPDKAGIKAFLSMLPRNNVLTFFELGMGKQFHRQFFEEFQACGTLAGK